MGASICRAVIGLKAPALKRSDHQAAVIGSQQMNQKGSSGRWAPALHASVKGIGSTEALKVHSSSIKDCLDGNLCSCNNNQEHKALLNPSSSTASYSRAALSTGGVSPFFLVILSAILPIVSSMTLPTVSKRRLSAGLAVAMAAAKEPAGTFLATFRVMSLGWMVSPRSFESGTWEHGRAQSRLRAHKHSLQLKANMQTAAVTCQHAETTMEGCLISR